ncbi:glia maturation factor beta [Martensiomyces pterosporus]|nr:glia maturation factor beta [Martensiomyces pterosporus]
MASTTCQIQPDVLSDLQKLRFAKPGAKPAVYIAKINRKSHLVVPDESYESISIEDLVDELPDDEPRYVVISYRLEFSDGRVSYPLVYIYYCPETAAPAAAMLYASTQQLLEKEADLGKVYMLRDKEELTGKWIDQNLGKYAS